jgi:hypothetical protein
MRDLLGNDLRSTRSIQRLVLKNSGSKTYRNFPFKRILPKIPVTAVAPLMIATSK